MMTRNLADLLRRWTRRWAGRSGSLRKNTLPVITILLIATFGCSEDDPVQPETPNSNSGIVREMTFGSPERWSTVRFLDTDAAGNAYFTGELNEEPYVSRIDQGSGLDWRRSTPTGSYSLSLLPANFGSVTETIMLVGQAPGGTDAMLTGYDSDGNIVVQQTLSHPDYSVWFSDIVMLFATATRAQFVLGGGARQGNVRFPYLAEITLSNRGDIISQRHAVSTAQPGYTIWELDWNGDVQSPRFYATAPFRDPQGELQHSIVFGIDHSLNVAWVQDVTPGGAQWVVAEDVEYHDGAVYTVGSTIVLKDDWWYRAGMIASIDPFGGLNWTRAVVLSDKADAYFGSVLDGDALYAVGEYSYVEQRSTTHTFGYGLLTKFNLPDADVVWHRTIGDPGYASRLWSIDIVGDHALCGGITRRFLDDYWHQGWFVEIDMATPAASLAAPVNVVPSRTALPKPSDRHPRGDLRR